MRFAPAPAPALRIVAVLSASFAIAPWVPAADPAPAAVPPAERIEDPAITEIVRRYVPEGSPGGIAVLVTRDGAVLHRRGYGVVGGEALTARSPLRLASVTKQFAAMCAAMLIEEGRLDPAQKVSHYLPGLALPVRGRELLVRDLLRHTSGLPNFISAREQAAIAEFKQERGLTFLTNETHAEWLTTMEPRRPPGREFEYTSSGYVLLARVIEVVAGEPFHVFQQRRIFDALGMSDATDSSQFNGSGNMAVSLVDYTKWDRALWDEDSRLLTPAGYHMLFARGALDDGEPVDYGFGWRLNFEDGRLVSAEHGGVGNYRRASRNQVERRFRDRTTVAIFAQDHPQMGRSKKKALVAEIFEALPDAE